MKGVLQLLIVVINSFSGITRSIRQPGEKGLSLIKAYAPSMYS